MAGGRGGSGEGLLTVDFACGEPQNTPTWETGFQLHILF